MGTTSVGVQGKAAVQRMDSEQRGNGWQRDETTEGNAQVEQPQSRDRRGRIL